MRRETTIARLLAAAKRDRNGGKFRERFRISPGNEVLCESKSEWKFWEDFSDFKKAGIQADDFSIQRLFEALVPDGRELIRAFDPRNGPDPGERELREAAGAIMTSDFSNITGTMIYNRMMEDLTPEQFVFQNLIPTQQTQFGLNGGERIPGITGLGDQAEIVAENDEYPYVGITEDWIETPETTKRGFIVPITKEALFFDRTGLILQKAGAVGESLRLNKEKRAIDTVIDENSTKHRYKWRGTTYATYQTTTPWDNVTASNTLLDFTDIDNMVQTANGLLDPHTGEPIVMDYDTLIAVPSMAQTVKRILGAGSIQFAIPGYAVSANPTVSTVAGNMVEGNYTFVTSRLLASRLATDTDWFLGNPRRAFVYMENWGITVTQAPAGNSDEFNRDIVVKYKCSERGQYATLEPRLMAKSTVA